MAVHVGGSSQYFVELVHLGLCPFRFPQQNEGTLNKKALTQLFVRVLSERRPGEDSGKSFAGRFAPAEDPRLSEGAASDGGGRRGAAAGFCKLPMYLGPSNSQVLRPQTPPGCLMEGSGLPLKGTVNYSVVQWHPFPLFVW